MYCPYYDASFWKQSRRDVRAIVQLIQRDMWNLRAMVRVCQPESKSCHGYAALHGHPIEQDGLHLRNMDFNVLVSSQFILKVYLLAVQLQRSFGCFPVQQLPAALVSSASNRKVALPSESHLLILLYNYYSD